MTPRPRRPATSIEPARPPGMAPCPRAAPASGRARRRWRARGGLLAMMMLALWLAACSNYAVAF